MTGTMAASAFSTSFVASTASGMATSLMDAAATRSGQPSCKRSAFEAAFFTSSVGTWAICIFSTSPHHLRCKGDQSAGAVLQSRSTAWAAWIGFGLSLSGSTSCVASASGTSRISGAGWGLRMTVAGWHVQRRCRGDQSAGERLGTTRRKGVVSSGLGSAAFGAGEVSAFVSGRALGSKADDSFAKAAGGSVRKSPAMLGLVV